MSESLSGNPHLQSIKAMGFSEADAIEALRRTNNDVNHAVELMSSGNCTWILLISFPKYLLSKLTIFYSIIIIICSMESR